MRTLTPLICFLIIISFIGCFVYEIEAMPVKANGQSAKLKADGSNLSVQGLEFLCETDGYRYYKDQKDGRQYCLDSYGYWYIFNQEKGSFDLVTSSSQQLKPLEEEKVDSKLRNVQRFGIRFDQNAKPIFPKSEKGLFVLPKDEKGLPFFPIDDRGKPIFPWDREKNQWVFPVDDTEEPIFPRNDQNKPIELKDRADKTGEFVFPRDESNCPIPALTPDGIPVVSKDSYGQFVIPKERVRREGEIDDLKKEKDEISNTLNPYHNPIVAIVLGVFIGIIVLCLICCLLWWCYRRNRLLDQKYQKGKVELIRFKQNSSSPPPTPQPTSTGSHAAVINDNRDLKKIAKELSRTSKNLSRTSENLSRTSENLSRTTENLKLICPEWRNNPSAMQIPSHSMESVEFEGPWSSEEDRRLLKAIADKHGINTEMVSQNHSVQPNWDFVANYVNLGGTHFRSARQCALRYQKHILRCDDSGEDGLKKITLSVKSETSGANKLSNGNTNTDIISNQQEMNNHHANLNANNTIPVENGVNSTDDHIQSNGEEVKEEEPKEEHLEVLETTETGTRFHASLSSGVTVENYTRKQSVLRQNES